MTRITLRESALLALHNAPLDTPEVVVPEKKTRQKGLSEETKLQCACVAHYDKRCRVDRTFREMTRLYAVAPNDGKRGMMQRSLAKRMGQRRGPFDLHFMDKRKERFRYVWIECKSKDGRLTQEQAEFGSWLISTPITCEDVRTLDEFIKVIG